MKGRTIALSCLVLAALSLGPARGDAQSRRRAQGIELPRAFGIGVTVYNQTQEYDIERLEVGLPGLDPSVLSDLQVDNDTSSYHLRLDYWLLPFLNVFVLGGHIDGTTTVDLAGIDIGLPVPMSNLTVEYQGTVYGAGGVLAGGWDDWFVTVEYNYTRTHLDVATSSVKAWVAMPVIGYRVRGGAIWVGGMYQDTQEHHEGTFELPYVGEVPFNVDLTQKTSWSYLVGGTAAFGEHWLMILQGGFGPRNLAQVTMEYRF